MIKLTNRVDVTQTFNKDHIKEEECFE